LIPEGTAPVIAPDTASIDSHEGALEESAKVAAGIAPVAVACAK
jgi:hypothetical protein